jgi:hypothetical protein
MSDSDYPMNGSFKRGGGSDTVTEPDYEHTNTALECLSHRHRREILGQLRDQYSISESEVIEQLSGSADLAKIQLRHRHLPKLMQARYITWNRQTNEISQGACFEDVAQFLELLSDHADELPGSWP